jgi:predicted PurR-regulated permease PerM
MPILQKIDISSSTIFRTILILLGVWFLYLIWDVLLMLFAAVVVASAIEPIADYLQRYRVPRAASVVMVYLTALLILFGMVTLMIDPLTQQIRQLTLALPGIVAWFEGLLLVGTTVDQSHISSLQEGLSQFGENIARLGVNIFQGAGTVVASFAMVLFVFVVAFYLVLEQGTLKKFFRLVVPAIHWPFAEQVIDRVQRGVGRWMLAQLALGFIVGMIVGVGLWLLGVPYALLLGLVAGVLEIIPVIGPILAAIPGIVVGLSQSLVTGIVVLGFYLVVQQVENHVLVPNIMRRAIGLHPLITIIAVLLGARLIGIAGAILAVPMATVVSIILSDVWRRSREEELPG